ncbi:hypothetical protein [Bradyrhizobium sp. URHC0002]
MKLAKPRIDIGFATNNAPAALAFWQNEIGLPFDYTQPRSAAATSSTATISAARS